MVMHVEGTEGRERGGDQDFERKSAMFSLASFEALIVNMWEYHVGLRRLVSIMDVPFMTSTARSNSQGMVIQNSSLPRSKLAPQGLWLEFPLSSDMGGDVPGGDFDFEFLLVILSASGQADIVA